MEHTGREGAPQFRAPSGWGEQWRSSGGLGLLILGDFPIAKAARPVAAAASSPIAWVPLQV